MKLKSIAFLVSLCLLQQVTADQSLDESEQLASHAGSTLKHLGAFLEGKKQTADLVSEVDAGMKVQYGKASVVPTNALLGGFQLADKEEIKTHQDASLAEWAASYGGKIVRTKFKVVRVVPDPKDKKLFKTEQLFEALVHGEQGQREIHQYWKASWRLADGHAVLLSLRETKREFAGLKGGATAFADHTADVLQLDDKELAKTLSHGANYWMRRLENAVKPDFFGQNGVSVADVDGDGREDVYVAQQAGIPNQLFIGQADGSYKEAANVHGLAILENTTCSLFVDLDNDGDQDAVIATSSGVAVFQNPGGGKYKLVKLMEEVPFIYGISAADYNADGLVDLYLCQYYTSTSEKSKQGKSRGNFPVPYPIYDANNGGRNALLKNLGKIQFEDVTDSVGLNVMNSRYSYAAMWEDWDNDGDQDLYVANDFGRNNYYQNDQGKFRDASNEVGLNTKAFGMGVTSGDYDGDGWLDIHVSNMFSSAGNRVTTQPAFKPNSGQEVKSIFLHLARGNALMMNKAGKFSDKSVDAGITVGRWSWASLSPDLNNDGYEDLLVANGFVTGKKYDDL